MNGQIMFIINQTETIFPEADLKMIFCGEPGHTNGRKKLSVALRINTVEIKVPLRRYLEKPLFL
jgi:hypothetical protein